jgi:glycosyltransferase involved in cell wall biosynthesis
MPTPLVTIAMPFFNSAATLELAIRSLLHQSYDDFELLLCDDGSNDHGLTIACSFDDPRIITWRDGRRCRLAARLNECIDRARGLYLARMDADDIAYPDRLACQLAFLASRPDVDLCGGAALVFAKGGRPLWRFSPPADHSAIIRSPFRGFPMWHPLWMGRIEWFRRWRYQETAWLAQDQELLLRSHRASRFANLPQVLLGYRRERISLRKLLRYKLLHMRYVQNQNEQPGARFTSWSTLQLLFVSSARFGANCFSLLAGPEHRLGHQAAEELSPTELAEWHKLWAQLSTWYRPPSNEIFVPASLLPRSLGKQGLDRQGLDRQELP